MLLNVVIDSPRVCRRSVEYRFFYVFSSVVVLRFKYARDSQYRPTFSSELLRDAEKGNRLLCLVKPSYARNRRLRFGRDRDSSAYNYSL